MTTKGTTEMTTMDTLTDATIRLDEAEREERIAAMMLRTLDPGAAYRESVESRARLWAAREALEAARVAYEAAQDVAAPED